MAEIIKLEDFEKEKAIELSDGTVLNVPQRTAELYESIVSVEKTRTSKSEYDYCKAMLELLFGKDGFKKIAPNGKKTNLDYLSYVTIVSQELFLSEKIEAEQTEIEKQANMLEPISSRLKALAPVINQIK